MQQQLRLHVAAAVEEVEGGVGVEADGVRRGLQDGVARGGVHVEKGRARGLDRGAVLARKVGLLSEAVDRVDVERGRAEDECGPIRRRRAARGGARVGAVDGGRDERERVVDVARPRRGELRPEDNGRGAVADDCCSCLKWLVLIRIRS